MTKVEMRFGQELVYAGVEWGQAWEGVKEVVLESVLGSAGNAYAH